MLYQVLRCPFCSGKRKRLIIDQRSRMVIGAILERLDLTDDPSKVNSEPFEGGWMMKVKVSDASDADALLDAKAYEAHCESGGH